MTVDLTLSHSALVLTAISEENVKREIGRLGGYADVGEAVWLSSFWFGVVILVMWSVVAAG